MNFTHNNHLKFGWGDGLYNFNDKNKKFWADFTAAEYIPRSFKDECLRSAKLIAESSSKPIMIALSGGIDSEITARSFLEQGIPFEVITTNIVHNGQSANSHDMKYIDNFVKKYGIRSRIIDVDFNRDLVKRLTEIRLTNDPAEPYYKVSIPFLCMATMLESVCHDYNCVIGNGDLNIKPYRSYRQSDEPKFGLYAGDSFSCSPIVPYEVSFRHSVRAVRFMCYTAEMMLAWLLDPDISHWIKYEQALMGDHGWMNIYSAKSFVMYKIWPDMEIRSKLTGYEKISEFESYYLDPFYNSPDSRIRIPVEELLNRLMPK